MVQEEMANNETILKAEAQNEMTKCGIVMSGGNGLINYSALIKIL